ncbi:MAG: hypothetical protein QOE98_2917 [Gaiellaceae bacterium]|nr:hypothetical protein [Gaiellaceae bacterium]
MPTPFAPSRQLGAFLVAVGMAIGAVGLPGWPHVAWVLSVGLNVLAAIAVLRLIGGYVARRAPFAAAALAAFLTGASELAPTLAPSPVSVSTLAVVAVLTFLAGFVLWLEAFESPAARPL